MVRTDAHAARVAVTTAFLVNGLCFATWVSRIPDARTRFGLDNSALGLLLLVGAVGSLVAMPTSGALIQRWGTTSVLRGGLVSSMVGLAVAGLGLTAGLPVTATGLFLLGLGIGVWDVAMNVEGAEVERHLGRTIMPRFHAAFSLGTVAGAGLGATAIALGLPGPVHLVLVATTALVAVWVAAGWFLPVAETEEEAPSAARAWREPRTLVIGVMVLALALTEGTANDWLAVALVDGYDVSHAVGVMGFALFVTAMTACRYVGTRLLDAFGRALVLWTTMAMAAAGVLLIVLGDSTPLVVVGIVLWGSGAALGFPVGMSAAADDPRRAAARVSVVSTIGYAAFLAGPPLLGFVGDQVGTLRALLVVAVLLVPAALAVPAARPPRPVGSPISG